MKIINGIQGVLISLSLVLLVMLPLSLLAPADDFVFKGLFFNVSFATVFLVMIIRPLADIFDEMKWLRRLVILRKGLGILSASIIVGFAFEKIIAPNSAYLATLFSADFFSFDKYAFFAHSGDISAFILLITSNRFSQKLLRNNWKRIQRLSYVYFYAGGIYEAFFLENSFAMYAMLVVTNLTVLAWAVKVWRKEAASQAMRETQDLDRRFTFSGMGYPRS